MSIRKWSVGLGLIVVLSMVLSACAAPTPPPAQIVKETVVVEKQVEKVVEKPVEKILEKEKLVVVTATPVPPTAVPPKPAAKAADTAVLALQQEPDTLHPLVGSMMARSIALAPIRPGCMRQNDKTEWVAMGCVQVPTIENGGAKFVGEGVDKHLEVTYKIKDGWRWTDGTPVTAKDAVYWWKLVMDPEFEIADRSGVERLYDVSAVDDKTILVKWLSNAQAKAAEAGTLQGNVPFEKLKNDYVSLAYSGTGGAVVDPVYWNNIDWLPSHVLSKVAAKDQAKSDYAKKPLGDGAYVVKEWKAGQELVLEKSDKPFPLGDGKLKTIVFRFFADTKSVIAALQKGEIDAATSVAGLSPNDAPDLDKIAAAGNYKVEYKPEYSWEHIDINTGKFPMDDVKVRQALAYATDKKGLVDSLYFGKQAVAELPGACLKSNCWAYTDNFTKYPYDLDKAKALLKEAGWDCKALPCTKKVTENGKEVTKNLEFTLMTTDRADRQKLAQAIQAQWKQANIGVNLQFLYGRGLFATCSAGGPLGCRTFDDAIYTWVGGDDPSFKGLYSAANIPTKENTWSGQNYPGFANKKAQEAINQSELNPDVAVSREKRKPFIETFFQEFSNDVPVIPLFVNSPPIVWRNGFTNYTCGPTANAACGWNAHTWELSK